MKRLLLILILTFSFQTLTKADDIRDFQIEGMSVGDSLLDYFAKEEIKEIYVYPNKKFALHYGFLDNSKLYDGFQAFYLQNDKKYIIQFLAGKVLYKKNTIKNCYKKMYEISEVIKKQMSGAKYQDDGIRTHPGDPTGKSTGHQIFFTFINGSEIAISCMDYSKEKQKDGTHTDNLSVNIRSKIFAEFLNSDEAYN
jgi:hypothetical protein